MSEQSDLKATTSIPEEPGLRPSVAPPASAQTRIEVRPTSPPPTRQEVRPASIPIGRVPVAPPRLHDEPRHEPSTARRPPLRDEPRRLPRLQPTLRVTIGEEVAAQIAAAQARGDKRQLAQAVRAGVAIGVDNEFTRAERKRQRRAQSAAFANAVKSVRKTLVRMRNPKSISDFEEAIDRFNHHIQNALTLDPEERTWDAMLMLVGTSEEELERLPLDFYCRLTAVPSKEGSIATFEPRQSRKRCKGKKSETTSVTTELGRSVEVIFLCGRPITGEPTRQIATGEAIDAPKATIIYQTGDRYGDAFIQMPDCRVAFMELDRQEVRWQYFLYESDRVHRSSVPLFGSFLHGFTKEPPCYGPAVMEEYVAKFLFVFTHEVGDQRFAYAAVLMKGGNVVVYEVPWSDELLEGDLIEIARGFEPVADPIIIDADASAITLEPQPPAPIAAA